MRCLEKSPLLKLLNDYLHQVLHVTIVGNEVLRLTYEA